MKVRNVRNEHKVFIVHGHASAATLELKDFLTALGLEAVVLVQEDDFGKAIIEKFECYASSCEFAFVVLTPDDRQAQELPQVDRWRARQNVILEMGWFMGKLGRARVALLHNGEVELPSDILGIIYIPFGSSIFEVGDKIRQRLAGQGLL
jgi:predicted nucleotide-binding protein